MFGKNFHEAISEGFLSVKNLQNNVIFLYIKLVVSIPTYYIKIKKLSDLHKSEFQLTQF